MNNIDEKVKNGRFYAKLEHPEDTKLPEKYENITFSLVLKIFNGRGPKEIVDKCIRDLYELVQDNLDEKLCKYDPFDIINNVYVRKMSKKVINDFYIIEIKLDRYDLSQYSKEFFDFIKFVINYKDIECEVNSIMFEYEIINKLDNVIIYGIPEKIYHSDDKIILKTESLFFNDSSKINIDVFPYMDSGIDEVRLEASNFITIVKTLIETGEYKIVQTLRI